MPGPPDPTCTTCAWRLRSANGSTCVARAVGDEPGPAVTDTTPACPRYEAEGTVRCGDCGACCREAYDSVPVTDSDKQRLSAAFAHRVRTHDDGWTDLHRVPSPTGCGTRCVALGQDTTGLFSCDMYRVRPQTCRDLDIGSAGCLFARQRVGLSKPA